jgi:phosphoribosyl-ATP pyrophosphohydrolase/phosphoribosyl-AMP cyclohydrolase
VSIDPASLAYGPNGLVPVVVQDVASGAVLMVAWADRKAVERTLATGEVWFWSRSRQRLWRKGETSGNVLRVVELRADCDGDTLLIRADPSGPACHTGARSCFETGETKKKKKKRKELGKREDGETEKEEEKRLGRATGGVAEGEVAEEGGPGEANEQVAAGIAEGAPAVAFGSGSQGLPRLELGWLAGVIEGRRGAKPDVSYTARLLAGGVELAGRKVGEEAVETVVAAFAAAADPARRGELTAEAADLLYHLLVLLEAAGADLGEVAAELRRRHHPEVTPGRSVEED